MYPSMSIEEIENTKPRDIEVLVEAHRKNVVDQMFIASFNSWQNRNINASDKKGRYTIKEFKDLFDYEKILNSSYDVEEKEKKISKYALAKIAQINNKGGEVK